MMDRNKSQCDVCLEHFADIKELAMHRLEHLVISISSQPPCPFCYEEMSVLTDFCQHVMNHFIKDELEQAKLIKWFSNQNRITYDCTKRKSLGKEWNFVTFRDFEIRLSVITSDFKCPYCDTFFGGKVQKRMAHVLGHFPAISSQRKEYAALWFRKLFENEESITIAETYCNYLNERKKLDSNSHLLEKLPFFENENTNKCRLCKLQLPSAADLYSHYTIIHCDSPIVYWNCAICNFKEADSIEFVNHVYKKHLSCICGKKFRSFDACLQHSKSCLKVCPYCKIKLPFESLMRHMNKGIKDFTCPYCKERKIELEMLKNHVSNCPSRVFAVYCPTCKNCQFTDDEKLRNHLLECKPWFDCLDALPCQPGENFHERSHFIDVYDIQGSLNEKIIGMIENNFL